MPVTYLPIDNEIVSDAWYPALIDMRKDGVDFNVNEGKRTYERQRELIREKGLWTIHNQTGAAAVSDDAPHIWTGRADHAIDFDNAAAVMRWLRAHGIRCSAPIAREPWHVVANLNDLRAYNARRKPDPFAGYPEDEERWIKEYDKLLRTNTDKGRRRVLRRVMKKRREVLWRLMQDPKQNTGIRQKRYRSLYVRTN